MIQKVMDKIGLKKVQLDTDPFKDVVIDRGRPGVAPAERQGQGQGQAPIKNIDNKAHEGVAPVEITELEYFKFQCIKLNNTVAQLEKVIATQKVEKALLQAKYDKMNVFGTVDVYDVIAVNGKYYRVATPSGNNVQ
jgi:hypothetical protein